MLHRLGIDIGGSSVKFAVFRDRAITQTARSTEYYRPALHVLEKTICENVPNPPSELSGVGLCVPGLLDPTRQRIVASINLPEISGVELRPFIERCIGQRAAVFHIVNDVLATATDIVATGGFTRRSACIGIGTGVGLAVLDDAVPLQVDDDSPGHLGQMDVSLSSDPPVGPDGGAGSLEGYMGGPALKKAYGSVEAFLANATVSEPPIAALVRAIRIVHAMYRPNQVILAGGIGIRLARLGTEMKRQIDRHLTSVARPDWQLLFGQHDFHAAAGAARLIG
jgi:predicted NBD/HSP70 family sugar kinase